MYFKSLNALKALPDTLSNYATTEARIDDFYVGLHTIELRDGREIYLACLSKCENLELIDCYDAIDAQQFIKHETHATIEAAKQVFKSYCQACLSMI